MILDALLLLSGAVSAAGVLTGQAANGAGSILSTNTMDAGPLALGGNQAGDHGKGENLYVEFSVLTAPTVGTTVRFQIIQADDAALTSNVQVINQTDDIPIASLPIGAIVPVRWDPAEPYVPKRYIGARYVNVGAIATFSVVAAVVKDVQSIKNRYYASGYTVL
jgi:predicted RecA/RadA family phage recombinase